MEIVTEEIKYFKNSNDRAQEWTKIRLTLCDLIDIILVYHHF